MPLRIAGPYVAERTCIPVRAADNLQRLRTMLAQARELNWAPGHLGAGDLRVGTPDQMAAGPGWRQGPIGRRWDGFQPSAVLIGAAALGPNPAGRSIMVELGTTSAAASLDAAVLEGVLPLIARRCVLAIGSDPSDGGQWRTVREQVILKHLLLGKSVREIAEELGRSPHTVHDHVKSLHKKLDANSRGELVARALGHVEMPGRNVGGASMSADAMV
ncbi:MAG: response regulator transcription factor [Burkholderiales bacterium]